jgi:mono/diheme cytochrome c family protein
MKRRFAIPAALTAMILLLALGAAAKSGNGKDGKDDKDAGRPTTSATNIAQDDAMRLEGEKRFHANCGRCHAAPPKFPPRMAATIVRHMRVRATITDEDTRFILHYLSQ